MIRLSLLFLLTALLAHAHTDPKSIRVHSVLISMPQREYVAYTRMDKEDGHYAVAMQQVKAGKASVLDVNCVTTYSGVKASLESIREFIYPTEYEPPQLPSQPDGIEEPFVPKLRTELPTAFETRNLGTTLEVEPTVLEDGSTLSLRVIVELVDPVGYSLWLKYRDEFGQADMKMPLFLTKSANLSCKVKNQKFALLTTFTGRTAAGELDRNQKILMFVRADIMAIKHEE
ncbi:type II and III secretion system protein [Rubritalea squalenifaciens DSM 18772]|uniref:Type II and III secretion system protein n=2 Tax=Rubritalea squalenifaciens TaxID=407226 RepID=A0A1M6B0P4_9BACT|nr:type II and III secretion system protein [Rubritalea squalenifaciens DSM 18772]